MLASPIFERGGTNLAFFKRLNVTLPHASSANTARQGVVFVTLAFESPEKT